MESKIRLFGHPIHTMLVVVSFGLFVCAIIFDTIYLFTNNPLLFVVSFFNIAIGIIAGVLAVIFGFYEWLAIPDNTREQQTGAMRGVNTVIVILLFAISWWLRSRSIEFMPSILALAFSYFGIVVGVVAAFVGSEPAFRRAADADFDTNLAASN